MKSLKTLIEKFIIPSGFLEIRRNYLKNKFHKTIFFPENKKLLKKEDGKSRCFILATGPSLGNLDLSLLKGELCISVSNFFVHSEFHELKPAYHVFAPSHPPITSAMYSSFLEDAFNKMNHQINIFMGESDRHIINSMKLPPNIEIFYYKSGGDFPVDLSTPIPPMRTVVHPAIYLSIYLGIQNIYLLGVDHSWASHYGVSKHFYKESESKLVQNEYSEWRHSDIGSLFKGYGLTWDIYRNIRDFYFNNNTQIINLNTDSVLDIFPKKDIKEILK